MGVGLSQILELVGRLDDAVGEDTPRERFRKFLSKSVLDVGTLRDYVEECLREKGENYNRALQDLVNYTGHLLEFEVTFGRYQGVSGQVGFDGHWKSSTGFHIVVEVKTSEAFAIKTGTLVGYTDKLISQRKIPNWHEALGLYVIGRPDPEIRQLENAIVAEGRSNQLRIMSVDSLLSLAELMSDFDIDHEEVLAVIRPSGPRVDPVVDLMTSIVAEPREPEEVETTPEEATILEDIKVNYWITPVKSVPEETAEECVRRLVDQEGIYAFGERTPGRKHLKPGDWMCFYATGGTGVIAHAHVVTSPEKKHHPKVRQPKRYPWVFELQDAELYLDEPTVIDSELRARLDAFEGKDPDRPWAWFVQATRKVTRGDFLILTRQEQ